jgi:GNAT superfamily N-acetyltransferase
MLYCRVRAVVCPAGCAGCRADATPPSLAYHTEVIDVRPVHGTRDFRRFVTYPYQRNRRDPHWIPPLRIAERDRLRPRKNPFFDHADHALLLARRGEAICGRIAAFDDRLHNQTHGDNLASFGFFEAEDADAARALLGAVEAWARARGRAQVRGPLNPSLNEEAGLLIDGFDADPMLLMPHNPPEYAAFIEASGYAKVKDLYAWICDVHTGAGKAVQKIAARFRQRERVVIRPLRAREFAAQVDRLRLLYCGAWEHNWGFVPPTEAEFRRVAADLKLILDPRIAIRAEVDGRMIGCAIALPDINQALKGTGGRLFPLGLARLLLRGRIVDQLRVLLVGLLPEHRKSGLYALLWHELQQHADAAGYRRAELSWVLEDNHNINHPVEQAGARRYKTYRIYQKALV